MSTVVELRDKLIAALKDQVAQLRSDSEIARKELAAARWVVECARALDGANHGGAGTLEGAVEDYDQVKARLDIAGVDVAPAPTTGEEGGER